MRKSHQAVASPKNKRPHPFDPVSGLRTTSAEYWWRWRIPVGEGASTEDGTSDQPLRSGLDGL